MALSGGTAPSRPDVSVVVPMRDAASYIEAALGSALCEAHPAIEVIVVDDGSSDNGPDIVARLASSDPRVRLLGNPGRRGPSGARNAGLDAARGEWIALLDADDTWAPGRLSRLLDVARRNCADLVTDNLSLMDASGRDTGRIAFAWPRDGRPRRLTLGDYLEDEFRDPLRRLGHVPVSVMKPLMRRAFILRHGVRYDERLFHAEDFKFYFDLFTHGVLAWRLGEPSYNYRVGHASLSHRPDARQAQALLAVFSEVDSGAVARAYPRDAALHRKLVKLLKRRRAYIAAQEAAVLFKEQRIGAAASLISSSPRVWPGFAEIVWTAAKKRFRFSDARDRRRAAP